MGDTHLRAWEYPSIDGFLGGYTLFFLNLLFSPTPPAYLEKECFLLTRFKKLVHFPLDWMLDSLHLDCNCLGTIKGLKSLKTVWHSIRSYPTPSSRSQALPTHSSFQWMAVVTFRLKLLAESNVWSVAGAIVYKRTASFIIRSDLSR